MVVSLNHQVNTIGQKVDWHTNGSGGGARNFVKSLFSRQHSDVKPPTPSQLRLVDGTKDSINNGNPFPELQIKPLMDISPELPKGQQKKMPDIRIDIPLHHVERIESIDPTMIVICTKDVHSTDEDKTTKEAARISFQSSDERDKVLIDLKVLVEWNKNRHPDIEEEFAADGIKARAKQAARFARRELELRETKKSREKRKQKYLKEGQGMKFTALAMANRD